MILDRNTIVLKRRAWLLTGISFAVTGILLMLIVTRWGIGVSPDSIYYIDSARNLLLGKGYVTSFRGVDVPLTHFPPFLPMVLAGIGALGKEIIDGARLLQVLLFAGNLLLIGNAFYKYTDGSYLYVIAGSIIALMSPLMLDIHSMLYSEPLFMLLGMAGIYLLSNYLEKDREILLISSAFLISLAFLTRFVGITLVITGIIALALLGDKNFYKRVKQLLLFTSISTCLMILSSMRNLLAAGELSTRKLEFHPIGIYHLKSFILTMSSWLFPGSDRITLIPHQGMSLGTISLLIEVCLTVTFCVVVWPHTHRPQNMEEFKDRIVRTPFMYLLYAMVYVIFILVSITFFDKFTPLDDRILSPIFVSLLIVAGYACNKLIIHTNSDTLKNSVLFTALIIICMYTVAGCAWISYAYENGRGFNGRAWKYPRIALALKSISDETPIYSTHWEVVYLLSGRPCFEIPSSNLLDARYLKEMKAGLEKQGALIVFFREPSKRPPRHILTDDYDSPESLLFSTFPLRIRLKEGNGMLLDVKKETTRNTKSENESQVLPVKEKLQDDCHLRVC